MADPLLEVEDLSITYRTKTDAVHAVTNASFSIERGEYFGLVGESGSGKSTIARALIGGLDANGRITSGTIRFDGKEIQDFSETQLNRELRWKEVAMIPQASMNSLDPLVRLKDQAITLARTHTDWSAERTVDRLRELFDVVGLPESRISDYPHQFSGGMQQRAIIALALLLEPSLLIADEPTTALDVIMQDQIIAHLNEIKAEGDVSMLLITHDISLVFENCDALAVLHGGQVAEVGSAKTVFDEPRHPYSILLQEAFPDIRFPDRELSVIEGRPPELNEPVSACTFADRCPWAEDACYEGEPPLEPVTGDDAHRTSCIRSGEMGRLAAEYLEPRREEAERREQ